MNLYIYVACVVLGVAATIGMIITNYGHKLQRIQCDCILCQKREAAIYENAHWFVIYDDFPVREGHILIIPNRNVEGITELRPYEALDLLYTLRKMVNRLKADFQIDGYNLGLNCGESAGQTIRHLHIHIIPRHHGDTLNPRGGIRNFLPDPLKEYPPTEKG